MRPNPRRKVAGDWQDLLSGDRLPPPTRGRWQCGRQLARPRRRGGRGRGLLRRRRRRLRAAAGHAPISPRLDGLSHGSGPLDPDLWQALLRRQPPARPTRTGGTRAARCQKSPSNPHQPPAHPHRPRAPASGPLGWPRAHGPSRRSQLRRPHHPRPPRHRRGPRPPAQAGGPR